ncbi:MAG TPA: long-chain fatty acid--CoA ligase [Crenotrichaceae bacterium]|nr:long-chain fatty acid--CoA ligase [Crenotrichaceae bacterium]
MSAARIDNDISLTLPGLFRERVKRNPDVVAYRQYEPAGKFWRDYTWQQTADEIARWQYALDQSNLKTGERVAIMLHNCREWVIFEQAALGLGLVVVPLFHHDSAENAAYILNHANVRVLLIKGNETWTELVTEASQLSQILTIISLDPVSAMNDSRLVCLADWLPEGKHELQHIDGHPEGLATIVYTSGTTGKPKGVMLSHQNILFDVEAGLNAVEIRSDDLFLSFLPLSHMFERAVGYYLPMMAGACVAYSRGIKHLSDDLKILQPSLFASVPRIFERIYQQLQEQLSQKPGIVQWLFQQTVETGWYRFQYQQHQVGWHPKLLVWPLYERLVAKPFRQQLGGNIRVSLSGGAALACPISKVFLSLGVAVIQGYGLTETSPLVSVNRLDNNDPASVGTALPGIEVLQSEHNELLVRGPNIMLGYWNNRKATSEIIDSEGWLHTGDIVEIREQRLYITGRIKEIIVLSTGEKLSPSDMEAAAMLDPCFNQVMIYGEAKPYPVALIVLNRKHWQLAAKQHGLDQTSWNNKMLQDPAVEKVLLEILSHKLDRFPGYARIKRVSATFSQWTVENAMLTPTLKIRRSKIEQSMQEQLTRLYQGHE